MPATVPVKVWICIPYAGEPQERLWATVEAANACNPAGVHVERDRHRSLPKTLNSAVRSVIGAGATHVMWLSTGDTVRSARLNLPPPANKGEFCLALLNGERLYPDPETYDHRKTYRDNQFCLSGAIVPVHVWQSIGGMDENLTYCSDWDLAMRVEHHCGWHMIPISYVSAWEYEGGLTKGAEPRDRNRDRARVSTNGQILERLPWPTR